MYLLRQIPPVWYNIQSIWSWSSKPNSVGVASFCTRVPSSKKRMELSSTPLRWAYVWNTFSMRVDIFTLKNVSSPDCRMNKDQKKKGSSYSLETKEFWQQVLALAWRLSWMLESTNISKDERRCFPLWNPLQWGDDNISSVRMTYLVSNTYSNLLTFGLFFLRFIRHFSVRNMNRSNKSGIVQNWRHPRRRGRNRGERSKYGSITY